MSKKNIDMLNGSLWDKILLYAVPLAVTGILQQLFNAADLAVVGRYRGPNAMAAVGSNAPIISILINLFVGVSLGTNVVLANAIGSGDKERASKCVHTSILTSVIGGVLLAIFGEIFADYAVRLMGVPEEIFKQAVLYLRIYLLGIPVILLYNFEASIYRAIGDTQTPFWALVISGIVNVVLNIALVCGGGMSVDGVAIATVVSNVISSIYLLNGLVKSDSAAQVDFSELYVSKPILRRILQIGIPAGVQGTMFSLANLVIQSSVNSLGPTVMAGSAAALNLEVFGFFVLSSFGQTCTSFVGQNNGAKKYDRCHRILYLCLAYSYLFTIMSTATILIFYKELLGLFCSTESVILIGKVRVIWLSFAFIFSVVMDVFSGYLRGFGKSVGPAVISLVCICGLRIVWIMTVFKRSPNFSTLMECYPVSLGATAFVMVIYAYIVGRNRKIKE